MALYNQTKAAELLLIQSILPQIIFMLFFAKVLQPTRHKTGHFGGASNERIKIKHKQSS